MKWYTVCKVFDRGDEPSVSTIVGANKKLIQVGESFEEASQKDVTMNSIRPPRSPAEKKQEIISRLFELEQMGKVATGSSQGPQKSCKGDEKQVNSLLKVIPPKVYITDSSSFKRLVQELTGNGKHAMSSPSPPPIQELHDHVPVISIEEYGEPEVCSFVGEDSYGGMQLSDDSQILGVQALSPLTAFTAFQTAWMNQQADDFKYQEHGAWSMEIDPFPFYDGYSFQTEEEIFSSQYDLSELYDLL